MYQVTEAYRTQMEKPLRNPSHVKIAFSLSDPDALQVCEAADNQHMDYGNAAEVATDRQVEHIYKTLEDNHFLLNGENALMPDSLADFDYQGYCGAELSDADGIWANQPAVTVAFSGYFKFSGLSVQFDLDASEFPSRLRVIAYKDGSSVFDRAITYAAENLVDAGGVLYLVVPARIPECNKLELRFVRSGKPYRRARLLSLVLGAVQVFDETSLTTCKQIAETDAVSSKLPRNDFDFTVFDTEKSYDPENPSGVWDYLEARQPVRFLTGYELDDGKIEWVPCCNTLTTGDITVNRTGVVTEVTFKSTSLIDHLDQDYDAGRYYPDGRSLYDLAEDVMAFAGYPRMLQASAALRGIITKAPLPALPVNQCLQLIANAARCRIYAARDGMIAIVQEPVSGKDFHMDFSKVTETPKTTKYPQLRTLTTEYQNVTVEDQLTELVSKAEVKDADNTEIEYTHDAAAEHTVSASGVTVITAKHYARKSVLTLTGTGTITIKGKKIAASAAKYSHTYNTTGDDLQVSNELISSETDAKGYADWIAAAMARRNEYTAPDRGYPELDVGDDVRFTPNSEKETPVSVLKRELSYNGAISGSGKYLIGGNG